MEWFTISTLSWSSLPLSSFTWVSSFSSSFLAYLNKDETMDVVAIPIEVRYRITYLFELLINGMAKHFEFVNHFQRISFKRGRRRGETWLRAFAGKNESLVAYVGLFFNAMASPCKTCHTFQFNWMIEHTRTCLSTNTPCLRMDCCLFFFRGAIHWKFLRWGERGRGGSSYLF